MIFTVDYGHALTGSVGARGNGFKEEVETRNIGKLVTSKLRALGHTVYEVFSDNAASSSEDVNYRVNKINSIKPDLSISIHLNASSDPSASGTEVWAKANSRDVAQKIVDNIAALGYKNRGVKDGSTSLGLVSLYGSQIPALLVECCFITSKEDMDRYSPEKIATAIVKGVTGKDTTATTASTTDNAARNASSSEVKIKEYPETGVFTCTVDKIYFRNKPYVGSDNPIKGEYLRNEKVNYDYVVITNKYVWISWVSVSTKERRYMPIADRISGEKWGYVV